MLGTAERNKERKRTNVYVTRTGGKRMTRRAKTSEARKSKERLSDDHE
jgi:hypothetical protein